MEPSDALAEFIAASKEDLATLLMLASRAVTERALHRLDPDGSSGVRLAHVPVIAALEPGGVRMGEIAKRIGVTRQAAAALCRDLDAVGVVVCEPDPADARAILVRLTDKGAALCAAATVAMRELEATYARELGAESFDQLRLMLAALIERGAAPIGPDGT